ncbi:hypothetical protein [Bradyrhizobium sp. USDA 4518]
MTLHGAGGARKYLNAAERLRFIRAAGRARREVYLFCLTLVWGGARISEALGVTAGAIDLDRAVVTFKTLKRRVPGIVREVPLPRTLSPISTALSAFASCSAIRYWRTGSSGAGAAPRPGGM